MRISGRVGCNFLKVLDFEFRVQSSEFGVQGLELRV